MINWPSTCDKSLRWLSTTHSEHNVFSSFSKIVLSTILKISWAAAYRHSLTSTLSSSIFAVLAILWGSSQWQSREVTVYVSIRSSHVALATSANHPVLHDRRQLSIQPQSPGNEMGIWKLFHSHVMVYSDKRELYLIWRPQFYQTKLMNKWRLLCPFQQWKVLLLSKTTNSIESPKPVSQKQLLVNPIRFSIATLVFGLSAEEEKMLQVSLTMWHICAMHYG